MARCRPESSSTAWTSCRVSRMRRRRCARASGNCCHGPTWCSPAASRSTRRNADSIRTFIRFRRSVDVKHFAGGRTDPNRAADQRPIPRPRIGYCGVIDERIDLGLIRQVAWARRDWQFVMIGPVAKIDPASLPQAVNIHYLGMKTYAELPAYMAGWDVAIMPFAHNDATRFISPTKTPEYLAAGCPVVSTSIRDVVHPYGDEGLVAIADTPEDFVVAIAGAMTAGGRASVERARPRLQTMSWDRTFEAMKAHVDRIGAAAPVLTRARVARMRQPRDSTAAVSLIRRSSCSTTSSSAPGLRAV